MDSSGTAPASTGLRRKSPAEAEFDKMTPLELTKMVRLEPRRFSTIVVSSENTLNAANVMDLKAVPGRRLSIEEISVASTYGGGKRGEKFANEFCMSSKGYRKLAWILCIAQMVSMTLWLTSILLVKHYWPAAHLAGRFLPAYLVELSGHTSLILFACSGSEPMLSLVLLVTCLILGKYRINWIRNFYVGNTWLSIVLIITGFHIFSFAVTVNNSATVKELMLDELKRYDDNSTLRQILGLAFTKVDFSAKADWDQMQRFFKCCGIDSIYDWYEIRNYFNDTEIETDETFWRVPSSCCQTADLKMIETCTRHPEVNTHLLWQPRRGCADQFQALLGTLGALAGVQVLVNWIIQGLTIFVMRSYYASLRWSDGTDYKSNVVHFFLELICLCGNRKLKPRTARSDWVFPINEVLERSN